MPICCRSLIFGLILVLAALAAPALAADYTLESRSMLLYFERDIPGGDEDAAVVPGYEYLQLDIKEDRVPGLSFHLYGWGRVDFADSGNYEDLTDGELIYGYVEYLSPDGPIHFKAGRTYVFEGVANESIDGVEVSANLAPSVSLSAYAGQPVSLATTNGREGDAIVGGRFSWHRLGYHEVGLSYKVITSDWDRDEERIGVDLSLSLPYDTSLLGYSTWNLLEGEWGEHFYEARIGSGPFEVRPQYHRYNLEGLFSEGDNSYNPFRVLARLNPTTTEMIGAEGYWYPGEHVEAGVKAKHYDYGARFGNAWYTSGIATYKWKILNQIGGELGRMQGSEDTNRFSLARGYIYYTLPKSFVTGDLFYTRFDEAINNEKDGFFVSAGVGRKFLRDALSLKLSLGYSNDPVFERDYRYTLVADYLLR